VIFSVDRYETVVNSKGVSLSLAFFKIIGRDARITKQIIVVENIDILILISKELYQLFGFFKQRILS